ncbi:response regulator [Ketogulonicigenium vulgare]|nr:response regulator [Ketogulonicigenium vulgare]ALJ81554.1 hypothetical protein KVH_10430 [Ketogulonicigenium vulgare]ANW34251.1 hypothetical protein KvSKV_10370 [Ketogulonicigenium vulgare]
MAFDQTGVSPSAKVLVVEDDHQLRRVVTMVIERAGLSVLAVANADDAIVVLAGNDPVSVLFTDVDMPGSMNGIDLAHRVSCNHPTIRVIVASGRSSVDVAELPAGAEFFRKPYDIHCLTRALYGTAQV